MKSAKSSPGLPDEVAGWFFERIQDGTLPAGSKLPSERDLTQQFGISRAVVREAMARLRADGLITAHQGQGAFVAKRIARSPFRIGQKLLGKDSARAEILEFLVAIESAAARLAATRATPDRVRGIHKAMTAMEKAVARGQPGIDEDRAFHAAVVEATGNPHFRALSHYLEHGVRGDIREARSLARRPQRTMLTDMLKEHRAIHAAIGSADPEAAAAAAEQHLLKTAGRLRHYLKR